MIQNLINNWRTTSLGLTSIAGAVINLVFAIKKGSADQTLWTIAITQVLGGLGLMFAGDQATSKASHDDTLNQLASIKKDVATTATAVQTGDTSILTRVAAAPTVKAP